jgi:predicted nuclease with TOPRIM domain
MSDSEQPTWEERLANLREKYEKVRDSISMDDVTRKLGDVATQIAGLPGEIAGIRERGYAFAGYLERKADVLETQWDEVQEKVEAAIKTEIADVHGRFDQVRESWSRLESQTTEKGQELLSGRVETALDEIASAVDAARSRIEGLYGEVPDNVYQTQNQLRLIETYLELADQSTVKWGPTEALYMVHEGEWRQTGKGKQDPDGLIYVTDQRFIFERKEKVGGRLGFGGETVQEVVFEVPVGAISGVQPEDKGIFGGKDLIHLTMSAGDYAETTFEVKSGGIDSDWYAGQLNRVINGEIEKERALKADPKVEEAVRNVPTTCTTCGATLPSITRGMTEITCEYCGTKMRI